MQFAVDCCRRTASAWSGVLFVANRCLRFDGAAKNANTPFKKIIHFTLYKDRLQIEKDGPDQFSLGEGDLEIVSSVLEAALRKGQSAGVARWREGDRDRGGRHFVGTRAFSSSNQGRKSLAIMPKRSREIPRAGRDSRDPEAL